jgi:xanthine dehydrogenase YagR molybdenum-binding subunit
MDELADALDMDPVEIRLRNDTPVFPGTDLRWSSRHLTECLRIGADRFGWSERARRPGTRLDGDWFVGLGMAVTSYRAAQVAPVAVSVTLRADGDAEVATSAVDLGTGMATVLAITTADALGIPIERVRVRLGDSALPPGGAALGSTGTAAVVPAVRAAVRAAMAEVRPDATAVPFAEVLRSAGRTAVTGRGETRPRGALTDGHAHWSFGAQFCEVRVNRWTREPRVTRMLGVMDIGRVVNAKAARSQIVGGMVWGLSAALLEGIEFDPSARMTNADLAGYLVPVNADVPDVDVVLLDVPDLEHNECGVRGAGEIGAGGMSAAIGNAIHNAVGIRLRELPITLDRMFTPREGNERP